MLTEGLTTEMPDGTFESQRNFHEWVSSFYWAITTMSTIGALVALFSALLPACWIQVLSAVCSVHAPLDLPRRTPSARSLLDAGWRRGI